MRAQYHIKLEEYSLHKFKRNLEERDMIPSRVSLKDDLDERFRVLENAGITNLKELIEVLKTKQKLNNFQKRRGYQLSTRNF